MTDPQIPPETIAAFVKSFEMFRSFAEQRGVIILGTVSMTKIEGNKLGATLVEQFVFNHPNHKNHDASPNI